MNDITARADALGNPASTPSDALEAARRIVEQSASRQKRMREMWPDSKDEPISDQLTVARALLAASPSPWRSMESAPKDGTAFLAAIDYDGEWEVRHMHWVDYAGKFGDAIYAPFVDSQTQPIAWMPLPSPPSEGGDK